MGSLTTYNGNCHCGANRFELTAPEITSAISCNCSLCLKRGLLWIVPEEGNLKITRSGDQALVKYSSAALDEEFCNNCGSCVTGVHSSGPLTGRTAVNVGNILGVNPFNLGIVESDSKAEENPPYTPPEFNGSVPVFAAEDTKVYTGGCHCGAVRIAVKSPALSKVEVKRDNCSICVRTGLVGVYPHLSQISIVGRENTKDYVFGRRFNGHPFCGTCGCLVYMILHGPPQSVVERLPEAKKEFVRKQLEVVPVNLRALDGVEWSELTIDKSDDGTEGYVLEA